MDNQNKKKKFPIKAVSTGFLAVTMLGTTVGTQFAHAEDTANNLSLIHI